MGERCSKRIYCFPEYARVGGEFKYEVGVEGAFGGGDVFVLFIGCGSKFEEIYERVGLDVDAFEFTTVGFEQK